MDSSSFSAPSGQQSILDWASFWLGTKLSLFLGGLLLSPGLSLWGGGWV